MYEILYVRQEEPDVLMRWFTSENNNIELYTWQDKSTRHFVRFRLFYDRMQDEKMLEWKGSHSLWFAKVNEGYSSTRKASPMLERMDTSIDLGYAVRLFEAYSVELDAAVQHFVLEKIRERLIKNAS